MHANCLWMDSWLRKQWYGQGDLAVSKALSCSRKPGTGNVSVGYVIKKQFYLF